MDMKIEGGLLTDLRCAVESADEVGCDFHLGHVRSGAEVAEFEVHLGFVDENVVGFDVGMQDGRLLHEAQCKHELLRVRTHCLHVQTDVLAVLLEYFTQVHTETAQEVAIDVSDVQCDVRAST